MNDIKELDLNGNPFDISINSDVYKDVLSSVEEIDGFKDYLKETMATDMKRYFSAAKENQDTIKGAFLRTQYLLNVLNKISKEKTGMAIDRKSV